MTRVSTLIAKQDNLLHCLANNGEEQCCYPYIAGKNGFCNASDKKEGDLKTPTGTYRLLPGFYRHDHVTLPNQTTIDMQTLTKQCGWCDAPNSMHYNQYVTLPFSESCEHLWRQDSAYDIILPIDYNICPVIAGKGSAIFFHLSHDDHRPTAGCVTIAKVHMLELLGKLENSATFIIEDANT